MKTASAGTPKRRRIAAMPVLAAIVFVVAAVLYLLFFWSNPMADSDLESIGGTSAFMVTCLLLLQLLPLIEGATAILRSAVKRRTWARIAVESLVFGLPLAFYSWALGFGWAALVLIGNGYLLLVALSSLIRAGSTKPTGPAAP